MIEAKVVTDRCNGYLESSEISGEGDMSHHYIIDGYCHGKKIQFHAPAIRNIQETAAMSQKYSLSDSTGYNSDMGALDDRVPRYAWIG